MPDTLVLRNYPDDDALHNPEKYPKALAFSPDIIPLYGTKADQAKLIDPASWRGFTGFPIVGGDENNVYIRGYGSGGPYVASLRVLPSELILWPQVWRDVQPVPSGSVVIPGGKTEGRYASDGPLQFRPQHSTGNTYSLVANISKPLPGNEENEVISSLPSDLKEFGVEDFLTFLSKDTSATFYNVIVADPTLKHVSATTRLRVFGREPLLASFRLDWHKGTPVPAGLVASLVDDRGNIVVPRVPFWAFQERTFLLEPSYDGVLLLNIFADGKQGLFEPFSGFSLQVFKAGSSLDGPPAPAALLGALNVIFEPHSTRNLRFASPAATQLREFKDSPGKADSKLAVEDGWGPIPVTTPAATGWWTRALLTDTNNFPHRDPIGGSPDIQPVGTDLGKQDFVTILKDPAVDYASANNIELVGNQKNYFFLRGHSTLTDIDVQSRLFAVGATTVNHPSQYLTDGLKAEVFGQPPGTVVNNQRISVGNPNQFYLFDVPFVIDHPPGDSNNHYCLIAEIRQKRKHYPVFPAWPSDNWNNHASLADFEAWVLSTPLGCWRNINWEPCQPGGQKCWEWSCTTQLFIPAYSPYSSFWTIIIECENSDIPPGSTWSLVCADNEIFPDGRCFGTRPISVNGQPQAIAGCHFAGARPGYVANLTLTITWCDGASANGPLPSVLWRLALTETFSSPILHLAGDAPVGSDEWPFYVTKNYPFIGNESHPSPLPSFERAGPHPWPHGGVPHFTLGQVRVGGRRR